MIGTLKDYTESLKQYIPEGQKISLWEQFLTGTSQQYQTITQQAQDVYAYDISQAYANYKRQQLQLQTNQQLGAGFKEQIGSQLQSEYGSAFSDIKAQEATALGKISEQYAADILTGEKQFTALGQQAQTLDKLLYEYAQAGTPIEPTGEIYKTETDEYGRETRTLTDAGRLWYYDVLNRSDLSLQDWLLSEDSSSTIDLEDRQAIAEALAGENRKLLLDTAAGIGGWTKSTYEETKSRLDKENEAYKAKLLEDNSAKVSSIASDVADNINFDWDDSLMLFGKQPLAFDSKYVDKNIDKLKLHYSQIGIDTKYAEEDLKKVMKMMKQWFKDTGTHKASTQKSQYKNYLNEVISARLIST